MKRLLQNLFIFLGFDKNAGPQLLVLNCAQQSQCELTDIFSGDWSKAQAQAQSHATDKNTTK